MLSLSQMAARLVVALLCGAIIGWEREFIGKDAGIRTSMLVAGGAAIFSMIGISLPFIMIMSGLSETAAGANGALGTVANIVIGIGFLGGGIIFKDRENNHERVHGLTTAAVIWTTAALGALAGIGLISFAIFSAFFIAVILYVLRQFKIRAERRRQLP